METHDNVDVSISGGVAGAGSGGSGGGSRWNPTKEQIDLLEGLYKQGIRTPSAEQIQQITNRLRTFGHIEGKNVFYWFQNHKARQRQKQKQDLHVSSFNRFLHKTSVFPPCPNVLCSPYYMPYAEMGLCQQQAKVLLPRSYKRRPTILPEKLEKNKCGRALYDQQANREYNNNAVMLNPYKANEDCLMNSKSSTSSKHFYQETLDLFPLHPTGNLQSKTAEAANANACFSLTGSVIDQGDHSNGHPFFDFFCGNSSFNGH